MIRILIALIMLLPLAAHAQDWPVKPVRMIVPFAAGGSTDVAARLVAEYLSRAFGQQVYVENRTGANGVIGIEAAAKSEPDGYTILVAPDAIASNPHVYKVNYALKDLAPVVQLSRQPIVLAAHPSLGAKTLPELIALAKREPGLRYGTGSGVGSSQHMVVQWFAQLAGIELEQVPYRGGGQAINDLIAGHVKLGALGSTPLIPHYKAGKLLLLAQTTEARARACPTCRPSRRPASRAWCSTSGSASSCRPAHRPRSWRGSTPRPARRSMTRRSRRAFRSALEPIGGSAEAFARLVREDYAKYERLVRELRIKAQQ